MHDKHEIVSESNKRRDTITGDVIDEFLLINLPIQEMLFWDKFQGDLNIVNAASKIAVALKESILAFEESLDRNKENGR